MFGFWRVLPGLCFPGDLWFPVGSLECEVGAASALSLLGRKGNRDHKKQLWAFGGYFQADKNFGKDQSCGINLALRECWKHPELQSRPKAAQELFLFSWSRDSGVSHKKSLNLFLIPDFSSSGCAGSPHTMSKGHVKAWPRALISALAWG